MKKMFLDKSFLPRVLEHFLNHIPLEKWHLDLWLWNGKINANMCLLSHLAITWKIKLGFWWTNTFWVAWNNTNPMKETSLADLAPRENDALFGKSPCLCLRELHLFSVHYFWVKPLGHACVCLVLCISSLV